MQHCFEEPIGENPGFPCRVCTKDKGENRMLLCRRRCLSSKKKDFCHVFMLQPRVSCLQKMIFAMTFVHILLHKRSLLPFQRCESQKECVTWTPPKGTLQTPPPPPSCKQEAPVTGLLTQKPNPKWCIYLPHLHKEEKYSGEVIYCRWDFHGDLTKKVLSFRCQLSLNQPSASTKFCNTRHVPNITEKWFGHCRKYQNCIEFPTWIFICPMITHLFNCSQ